MICMKIQFFYIFAESKCSPFQTSYHTIHNGDFPGNDQASISHGSGSGFATMEMKIIRLSTFVQWTISIVPFKQSIRCA